MSGIAARIWALCLAPAAAVALGVLIGEADPSLSACLIVAIGLILFTGPVLRLARSEFDILDPVVWLNGALAVMFVVRPAADLLHGQFIWRQLYDMSPKFDAALVVALVGCLALQLGYAASFARRVGQRLPALPAVLREGTIVSSAWIVAFLGVAAYALYARSVHVSPLRLISGGVTQGGNSTAYLYLAPFMVIPAALLLMHAGLRTRTRSLVICALVLAAVLTNSLAPAGQRMWLMLLLMPFLIYPMLRVGYRPSPVTVLLIAVPAFFLIVAMRDLGTTQSGPGFLTASAEAWSHPIRSLDELTLQQDTEMFDALAVELENVPSVKPYKAGATLLNLAAAPIPRIFWNSKPRQTEDELNALLFSQVGYHAGRAGAAYSVLGGFYYEGGLIPVFIWMFVIGAAFRALYEYFRSNHRNHSIQLLYATALPFSVVLMRGNVQDTLSRSLFVVVPILVVVRRSAAREARSDARAPRGMKSAKAVS